MRILFDKNVPIGVRRFLANKLALIVLRSNIWPIVRTHAEAIAVATDAATPGSYAFVEMPIPPGPR